MRLQMLLVSAIDVCFDRVEADCSTFFLEKNSFEIDQYIVELGMTEAAIKYPIISPFNAVEAIFESEAIHAFVVLFSFCLCHLFQC